MTKNASAELYLLDTHLLMWGSFSPERLSKKARKALEQDHSLFVFSVVSLWEIAIKRSLKRPDFQIDPHRLRSYLLEQGMTELQMTAAHAVAVAKLPLLHRDPFDRLLITQASVERMVFLTSDSLLGNYSDPVRVV